jgi:hypothetical protein
VRSHGDDEAYERGQRLLAERASFAAALDAMPR